MNDPNDVELIIFDTDGTIFPTLEPVWQAIRSTFKKMGWPLNFSRNDIERYFGTSAGELYRFIAPEGESWEYVRDKIRNEYTVSFHEYARTYEGVRETLETLKRRGYTLVLYSNASKFYFNLVISSLGIGDYFDYMECIEENNLTKTELVNKIKERFDSPSAAVVGDRIQDIEAAAATGSLSVGVRFGYGGDEPGQADMKIDKFSDLLRIFDRRLPVFRKILDEIERRRPQESPFIVGINGIDGAGKSEFAESLMEYLISMSYETQLIAVDDFHHPQAYRYAGDDQAANYYNRSFNINSIIENLLDPLLRNGALTCKLTLLDWRTDKYEIERKFDIGPGTIVIFEGVFLFRKELAPYIDYKIFIEIPFEESKRRALLRDAHISEADLKKYDEKYLPAQAHYLEEYPPKNIADMIIDNHNWEHPFISYLR